MKIITSPTLQPTPVREWDYQAVFDNYDGGDPIGFGATPDLAKEDLLESTRCDICGDIHYPNTMPITCETGDGV